jgi:PKD repeat protein
MKVSPLIFLLYSTLFFGCKKFVETPKETCFIPFVDFVAYHVDPNSLEVTFSSVTSYNGTITSHKWDFGDGTTFNGETPPPHKYPPSTTASKTYNIKYTVANECGEAYWTKEITVSACLPDVKFTYTFLNDSTIEITNHTSSASTPTYIWDFGDGSSSVSTAGTLTKTYAQDKAYTISLKASNACGDNFYSSPVTICRKPLATQNITQSGCGTVTINASSSKNGAKFQWNFGNGVILPAQPGTSSTITYTYPTSGAYNITLLVLNQSGCDSAKTSSAVTVSSTTITPNNQWSYTSDDLDFNFSRATVTNATTYSWNFGDGTTAQIQNPGNKTYVNPGTYTITLAAGNGCTSHNFTASINVPFFNSLGQAPNTGMQQVIAASPQQIWFLGTNGKLYSTDTAGRWSAAINLPSSLSFNADTRLFRDANNNLWVYGKNEVAKLNTSSNTWTTYFNALGWEKNITILSIAVDYYGNLWTVADRQIRRNSTVISSGNNQYSSIGFAPANGRVWVTASNRSALYYASVNGGPLNTINLSQIAGGAEEVVIHPDGNLYVITGNGFIKVNTTGTYLGSYSAANTGGLLSSAPQTLKFDNEGNIWVVQAGRLLKIPINSPSASKNYSFTPELTSISSVDVLNVSGTDNDLLLSKTSGNVAIRIK